jgi:hypothetical protein
MLITERDLQMKKHTPSSATAGSAARVDAGDTTERELEILFEAQRLMKTNGVPRHTWHTWDVWAGRTVYHEEESSHWAMRVLKQARENTQPPNV